VIAKVLLAYDGSESAEYALAFAQDLAQRYGAQLHVLAVARPPDVADDVETEAIVESGVRQCRRWLDAAKHRLGRAPIQIHYEVAVGHPAEQIVLYAERHGIDHIVVGHRGRTLFERWLIGSVARQVIAYAHCAVTVVRR
jgi:nucleotide-binding universal stress UspA family protein